MIASQIPMVPRARIPVVQLKPHGATDEALSEIGGNPVIPQAYETDLGRAVEGNKIMTNVDMLSNEIYTGANQNQTRFFRIEGDKPTLRTPEIVSTVRPGKSAVGTITLERER